VKPFFKVRPQNTTVYEGESVQLHCVVDGVPVPTVRWDKNTHVDDFDKTRIQVGYSSLRFLTEIIID
jgi:hypothetical protein